MGLFAISSLSYCEVGHKIVPIVALMLANPFELVLLFAVTIGCCGLNCLSAALSRVPRFRQSLYMTGNELTVCRSVPAFGSRL